MIFKRQMIFFKDQDLVPCFTKVDVFLESFLMPVSINQIIISNWFLP